MRCWDIVLQYAKEHPKVMVGNLAFMSFVPINEVFLPHLYGELVTAVQGGLGSKNLRKACMRPLIMICVTLMVVQLGYHARDILDEYNLPRFENFVRTQVLRSIMEKYEADYLDLTTGDIVAKLGQLPDVMSKWIQWMNDYIIPYMFVFVAAFVYMYTVDKYLAFSLLLVLIIMCSFFVIGPRKCHDQSINKSSAHAEFHEKMEDTLANLAAVYGSSRPLDEEIKRMKPSADAYIANYKAASSCTHPFKLIAAPVLTAFVGFFVLRSIHLISVKRMTTAKFVSFFMIITYVMGTIFWIVDAARTQVYDTGILANVDHLMAKTPPRQPSRMPPPSLSPPVRDASFIGLYDVTYAYPGATQPVIDRLTLSFERGERTVLVGPVGTGKSTVLKLLAKLYQPTAGDLFIGGRWYSQMTPAEVRSKAAYVPQDARLFNETVLFNIRHGNDASKERITAVLQEMGLEQDLPLDKLCGKNGSNLSGGQRQMVWCIRVLLRDPEVIILDEPTASLDERTKLKLLQILETVMAGKTVIMVTHDPFLVKHSTRQLRLGPDEDSDVPQEHDGSGARFGPLNHF